MPSPRSKKKTPSPKTFEEQLRLTLSQSKENPAFVRRMHAKLNERIDEYETQRASQWDSMRSWIRVMARATLVLFFAVSSLSLSLLFGIRETHAQYVGELTSLEGNVFITRSQQKFIAISRDRLQPGDVVELASDAKAEIEFYSTGKAKLRDGSRLRLYAPSSSLITQGTTELKVDLEHGTLEKLPEEAQMPVALTVQTSTSTLRGKDNSSFAVSTDASIGVTRVTVSSSTVELYDEKTSSTTEPTLIASGEMAMVQQGEHGLAVLKVPSEGLITTAVKLTTTSLFGEETVERTTSLAHVSTAPLLTTELTSEQASTILKDLSTSADIAEVKLAEVLDLVAQNKEMEALAAAKGYMNTLSRMTNTLKAALPQADISERPIATETATGYIEKSPLLSALDTYETLDGQLDPTLAQQFQKTRDQLLALSRFESSLLLHISMVDGKREEQPSTIHGTLPQVYLLSESHNKDKLINTVHSDVRSQVRAVLDLPVENRSEGLVRLLTRIPNDPRHMGTLEMISAMVPQDLRGYVVVKEHHVQHAEAPRKVERKPEKTGATTSSTGTTVTPRTSTGKVLTPARP